MTQGLFDQWGTLSRATPPYEIKNSGGERIPAWSPVEIDSSYRRENRLVLKVKKPAKLGWRCRVLVNGGADLEPDDFGVGFFGPALEVTFDATDGTPKDGESWGPVKDSFKVRKHVPGGRVLEDGRDGKCVLLRYEPPELWGRLSENLAAGGKAEAVLYRSDPETTVNGARLAAVVGITFDVLELTHEINQVSADTLVVAAWDEIMGDYVLKGWVCA